MNDEDRGCDTAQGSENMHADIGLIWVQEPEEH